MLMGVYRFPAFAAISCDVRKSSVHAARIFSAFWVRRGKETEFIERAMKAGGLWRWILWYQSQSEGVICMRVGIMGTVVSGKTACAAQQNAGGGIAFTKMESMRRCSCDPNDNSRG